MSYADAAASGPPQSAEEARANPVPELMPTDQSVDSLVDVDHGVSVVPSDFKEQEVKTETQAERIQLEAEKAEAAAKKKAEEEKKKLPKKSKKGSPKINENPILASNAVIALALAAFLGYGAIKKHQAGQLTWKLAGMWGAGLAALGAADYGVSTWLYKNYPPKNQ